MKTYDRMKDSGYPWMGEIPAHWRDINPKALFKQRKERAKEGERQLTASQQYGVLYQDEYMALTGSRVVVVQKDFDILKHVEAGDFVISMRSFQGGLEYSPVSGSISSAYVMLIPNKELVHPPFYKWLLKSSAYIRALQSTTDLVRDGQAMRFSNFAKVRLLTAPLEEQTAIAAYLDSNCAQIDSAIEEAKTGIEKIKKWKASIIFEAVTKGLNRDVEFKDSRDPRLGMVPTTWKLVKVKQVAKINPATDTSGLTPETEVTFAPMECIRTDKRIERHATMSDNTSSYSTFNEGDIALAKVTPCFQNSNVCMMVNLKNGFAFGSSELFNIRALSINPRYLLYYFMTDGFKNGGVASMTGVAGLQRVSSTYIRNALIPFPPEEEQKRIVDYLDARCKTVDELVVEKTALISDLESYKRSLIYEAVTGKRKVV